MNSQICIDVSLALKLVLAEEDSPKAQRLWDTWIDIDAVKRQLPRVKWLGHYNPA